MEHLADRVIELLDHSEPDAVFQQFVDDLLGSPVSKALIADGMACYTFPELGVTIVSENTRFYSAQFHIEPVTLEGIPTLGYSDSLPFGVGNDYTRRDVQKLLGRPQSGNKTYGLNGEEYIMQSYQMESLQVVFWYSVPSEKLFFVRISKFSNLSDEPDETPDTLQRPRGLMRYFLLAKAFWLACLGRFQDPHEP